MITISNGIYYDNLKTTINGKKQNIHITVYEQGVNPNLTLLISKVSEAIMPNIENNHIGEGATMDSFIEQQKGVRFIINGGFSHYRKNFYNWRHQSFNVGDPVGLVKIRQHFFEDYIDLAHYGFLVQKIKGDSWEIVTKDQITKDEKYILGCTPLLIYNNEKLKISDELMAPIKKGTINPPSVLAHGLENHPRTAVGVKGNKIYFITVEGNVPGYVGCTLIELQNIGVLLKLESLLNLDGGGSSQFRINYNEKIIKNNIAKEDESRILGHVLALFDESIK